MTCLSDRLPPLWWRDANTLQAELDEHRSFAATGRIHSVAASTLKSAWSEHGLAPRQRGALRPAVTQPDPLNAPLLKLAEIGGRAKSKPPPKVKQRPGEMERVIFIGDPHIPYHHHAGLELWLAACKDFKPTVVVSTGDFMDFFAVSSYSKDPRRAFGLAGEIEEGCAILDRIEKVSPGARRIFIAGNHEDRLQRYLQDKAPELFSFIDVEKLLDLPGRGWEYVPYKAATKVGKINLTHDVGVSTRYAVYRAAETFQSSVVTGHTHRMAYVVEGDATGGTQVSASFGWLGDVSLVDYMNAAKARRNWALGFGYGYLSPRSGHVHLIPVPIVKGTCVVEGRLYEAEKAKRKKAA